MVGAEALRAFSLIGILALLLAGGLSLTTLALLGCLGAVGTPAEKTLNRYIEAANDWGGCVSELGCGSAEIEPVLQRRWRVASHFLSEAEDGLRQLSR